MNIFEDVFRVIFKKLVFGTADGRLANHRKDPVYLANLQRLIDQAKERDQERLEREIDGRS